MVPVSEGSKMKTFKNTAADLDSEATVILFAESETVPSIRGTWVECTREELETTACVSSLFVQAGVRYYGFL
jgi:hypothetical protein